MTSVAPMQDVFWRACEQMLFVHTNPWELDAALLTWGYGLGPCEAQDLIGLDEVLRARFEPVTPVLPRMVSEGRLGKKTGWGFYRYPGGGGAVADPLIEDLILEEARFAGQERVDLEGLALVARLHGTIGGMLLANPEAAVALLHFPARKLGELSA